ncbi:MAG: hotdog fold domain-containing protein [Pseudomonadota bacterium]
MTQTAQDVFNDFGYKLDDVAYSPGVDADAADQLSFRAPPEGAMMGQDFILSVLGAALRLRVSRAASGAEIAPVSVSCEMAGPIEPGERVELVVRIDRKTRAIAFASADASSGDGRLLASATSVFRIIG